jgi:hypothetical protein
MCKVCWQCFTVRKKIVWREREFTNVKEMYGFIDTLRTLGFHYRYSFGGGITYVSNLPTMEERVKTDLKLFFENHGGMGRDVPNGVEFKGTPEEEKKVKEDLTQKLDAIIKRLAKSQ